MPGKTKEERIGVEIPPELDAKTNEELFIPNEDAVDELRLLRNELAVLEVKLFDDVVLTKLGRGGITTGLPTDIETDIETNGTLEVLFKVPVELGTESGLEVIVADDVIPWGMVGVTVESDKVFCSTVESVKEAPDEEEDGLALALGEFTVDTTRDMVSLDGTEGRVGTIIEFDVGKVAKDDAGAEVVNEEPLELLEVSPTPEVADGLGRDWVERRDFSDDPGVKIGVPGGPGTVEDVLKEPTEDTSILVEATVVSAFEEVPGPIAGGAISVLLDGTGGKIDNETETVSVAPSCTLDRAEPDEIIVGMFDEPNPEPCGLLILVLMGAVPDVRPGLCVFCGAPLDVDDLPNV